jgi:PAS domain S-box-containing protein
MNAWSSVPFAVPLALAAAALFGAALALWLLRYGSRDGAWSFGRRARGPHLLDLASDAALQRMRDAVIVLDGGGDVLRLNAAARGLLGEDAEGSSLAAAAPWLDLQAPEVRMDSAGGGSVTFEVEVVPLPTSGPGVPAGRLVILRSPAEPRPVDHRELDLSRAHAELLFQASPEAIALLEPSGAILRVNGEFTRMFGYSMAEARGRLIDDLLPPPEMRAEAREVTDRVRRGSRVSRETVRVRKDGSALQVYLMGMPLLTGGSVVGIYAMFRDETARKRAEERLQQSEERYRALFDQAPVGVFHYDTRLRVTHANQQFVEMSRMPLDELLGFDIGGLPDSRVLPAFQPALRGDPAEYDGPYRTPTGLDLWVSIRIAPLRDTEGVVVGGVGIVDDVTERRRAERERLDLLRREKAARAAAQHAEERALLLAEAAELFADSLEADAALQRMARFLVHRFAERCEVYCLEGCGQPVRFCAERGSEGVRTHEPEAVSLPGDVERMIASLAASRSVLGAEGRELTLLLQARGRTLGLIRLHALEPRSFGPDEVRLLEEIARRAALALENVRLYREVQQAVVGRDRLLQAVSHDLRNPLGTILLNASSLLEGVDESRLGFEAREQLDAVALASEQMNRLIGDLLDTARATEGQLPLTASAWNADALLSDAAALVRARAAEKRVRIERTTAALPLVRVDRDRVLQVFGNLLENAVRFTPAGGAIRMWAELDGSGVAVRFAVQDSGPGIAEEFLPRLFERFWQATPGSHGGAGLGLSIARGIVEAHGGRIWVDTAPGAGTTFRFTLPVDLRGGAPVPTAAAV